MRKTLNAASARDGAINRSPCTSTPLRRRRLNMCGLIRRKRIRLPRKINCPLGQLSDRSKIVNLHCIHQPATACAIGCVDCVANSRFLSRPFQSLAECHKGIACMRLSLRIYVFIALAIATLTSVRGLPAGHATVRTMPGPGEAVATPAAVDAAKRTPKAAQAQSQESISVMCPRVDLELSLRKHNLRTSVDLAADVNRSAIVNLRCNTFKGNADVSVALSEKVIASAEMKYGAGARMRLVAWTRMIADNGKKSETEKLKLVNDFFNQIPSVSDMEQWGLQDYWATPVELLASNGGDCEDFAIGKYFTLLALGFPMDRLRINYVIAINQDRANQAHMVLTYYPNPDTVPFILDNLIKEIKLASARADLIPVYSLNGSGLWLAKESSSGKASGSLSRITLWAKMPNPMGKEL